MRTDLLVYEALLYVSLTLYLRVGTRRSLCLILFGMVFLHAQSAVAPCIASMSLLLVPMSVRAATTSLLKAMVGRRNYLSP
jgi:hypothetical protein